MKRTLGHPCPSAKALKARGFYEGARLPLGFSKNDDVEHWVLFCKNLRDPKARAYYFAHVPKGTSLAKLTTDQRREGFGKPKNPVLKAEAA